MKTLYIDTSSNYLYSGIVINNEIKAEINKKYEKDLSKEALPKIIELFEYSNIEPKDLDKIIVVTGPGSFTGIRIGVTIAKIMAWSLNISITPISSLSAMAISNDSESYKMPLIDARRGYVYGGIYDKDNKPLLEDCYIKLEALLEKVNEFNDMIIITNNELNISFKKTTYNPDILKIVKYYNNNEGRNPHLINPSYLKKTEAEEKAGL